MGNAGARQPEWAAADQSRHGVEPQIRARRASQSGLSLGIVQRGESSAVRSAGFNHRRGGCRFHNVDTEGQPADAIRLAAGVLRLFDAELEVSMLGIFRTSSAPRVRAIPAGSLKTQTQPGT